jgi:hypothetical protein
MIFAGEFCWHVILNEHRLPRPGLSQLGPHVSVMGLIRPV